MSGSILAMSLGIYVIGFSYGTYLIANDGLDFENMFLCVMCIVLGGQQAGQSGGWLPDIQKSKAAAAEMFWLIDRKPKIMTKDLSVCGFPAICSGAADAGSSDDPRTHLKYLKYAENKQDLVKARKEQASRDRGMNERLKALTNTRKQKDAARTKEEAAEDKQRKEKVKEEIKLVFFCYNFE